MNPANFNVGGSMPAAPTPQMPRLDNNQVMMNYVAQALHAQGTYTGWRAEVPMKERVVRVYQMWVTRSLSCPWSESWPVPPQTKACAPMTSFSFSSLSRSFMLINPCRRLGSPPFALSNPKQICNTWPKLPSALSRRPSKTLSRKYVLSDRSPRSKQIPLTPPVS